MILKQILITIICFTMVFPASGFVAPGTVQITPLLSAHRDIISGVGSFEMVVKHGKELADATFKFMGDPKNKKFLQSEEGIELQKHQQMLTNFLAVKDHFEKCVKDKKSKRRLNERILEASFQNMSKIKDLASPCLPPNPKPNQSYLEFNKGIMKIMKKMVKPDFQNQLSKQIITNTAKSLLAFRQKFRPGFMNRGYFTQAEMNQMLDDVCIKRTSNNGRGPIIVNDVCRNMDPKFKTQLSQDLIDFSKLQKNEKMTPVKATNSLNAAIDRLNASLSKIIVTKDIGYIYDTADMSNERTKKDFDKYVNQYMVEVSKDAGPLLLTKTIKNEAGSIKRFNKDDTQRNKKSSRFQFTQHKKVKIEDIKASIEEVENKIMNQAKDTLTMAFDATKVKGQLNSNDDDISDLVKINPFAAGQVLLHEPQYAGLMCDAVNNINKNDVDDANFDKYFTVGAAILGGALLLTGVGTIAGAYLITGSLTAGIAAGTIGGSIIGYTAIAGTAMELGNLSFYGKKSYENYQEMNRLESAYLTQNADTDAIIEAKNALVEFKDARFSAVMSLANAGLNLLAAGSVFNILKFKDAKVSPDEVKAAAKIMRYLSQTVVAKRLNDVAKIMGNKGLDKIDAFLLALAKVSETNRIKFLELLNDTKMTPSKLKEIIETSLEAAKNCSKV